VDQLAAEVIIHHLQPCAQFVKPPRENKKFNMVVLSLELVRFCCISRAQISNTGSNFNLLTPLEEINSKTNALNGISLTAGTHINKVIVS
jgi:hypothetical protein